MRHIYLLLAALGAALPMYYFLSWFVAFGFDIGGMVEAWNVNDATTGLVYDLTVAAAALFAWAIWETARSRRWLNLVALPVTLCVGVGCGLPLYLWLRSR
ncbi:DUF2834 domain-containing protein [Pikeienuella piscinae]|uniref:DUF2834 domain-containing protein n=1 Tax=Pikeienuella piscinae TaxID=2748098 RepID=A0A7L5BWW8_9RHOB|nr:DUF2834 domain-containing protein [Pikeienuella piscinae]QIE55643.1 DUF2834 domain-containing protein [Pikeienuella piscinae]